MKKKVSTIVFWLAVAVAVLGCCIPVSKDSIEKALTATSSTTGKNGAAKTSETPEETTQKTAGKTTANENDKEQVPTEEGDTTETVGGNNQDHDYTYDDFVRIFTEGDFSLVTPEFKAEMDAYEAFYDEYIAFMKKYLNGEGDWLQMIEDYEKMIEKIEEWDEIIDNVDESQLTPADDAYYLYVTLRVLDKQLSLFTSDSGETTAPASSDPADRPQRINDGGEYVAHVGMWDVQIPSYWEQDKTVDYFRAYAETGGKCAMIQFHSSYDEVDPVGFYWLEDESEKKAIIEGLFEGMTENEDIRNLEEITSEVIETAELKGVIWTIRGEVSDIPFSMYFVVFPSEKDNNWLYIQCMYTDNTDYQYEEDFRQMLKSMKPVE